MRRAKFLRDDVGAQLWMLNSDDDRRQLFNRQSTAADLCRGRLQLNTEFLSQRGLKLR